jgi:hypothetical protein
MAQKYLLPWDRCYDLKNIVAKNSGKKYSFWLKTVQIYAKVGSYQRYLNRRNFHVEKIVLITLTTVMKHSSYVSALFVSNQGDQTGQIFAYWAIVYFWQLFWKL